MPKRPPTITFGNTAEVFACLGGKAKTSWTFFVVGDLSGHVENVSISLKAAAPADKCKPSRMTWHAPPFEYSERSFAPFPVHITVNWRSGLSTSHLWTLELTPGEHNSTIPVPEDVLTFLTRHHQWKNMASPRSVHREIPRAPVTLHFDPSAPLEAVVQFDYKPQQPDEIKLVRGECIQLLHRADKDWLWGRKESGTVGLFPSGYVQPIESLIPPVAALIGAKGKGKGTRRGVPAPQVQYNTYIHHHPHADYAHPRDHLHDAPQSARLPGSTAPSGYARKLQSPGFMHYEGHGYSNITLK